MANLTGPLIERGSLGDRPQPELDAGELVIRPWRIADVAAIVTAYQDPAIQQWHVRTVTSDEAVAIIEASHRDWLAESRIDWAVCDSDGQVLGRVALNNLKLYEGVGEFAYWTLPSARGRKVAVRAVHAVSDWAFGLGFHRLSLRHSVHNTASCRVAEKAGFAFEGINRQHGRHADGWHDMHLHARLATDPVPAEPMPLSKLPRT